MFNYDNKLRFLIWQDKKPIYMITNIYDGSIIIKNKFNYSDFEVNKIPYMISECNKFMDRIDRLDHYNSNYISNHFSRRQYKKIIVYVINVALSNANIKALDFRLSILSINDINNKDNKLCSSVNIQKDPKHPIIKDAFKKIRQKNLLLDNDMEICFHVSMNS